RMQHVNQTEVAEALGADPLLGFGFYPRHDQGVFLKREGLTYRVVASHSDDPVGAIDQRCRVVHKVQDAELRASLGLEADVLALFPGINGPVTTTPVVSRGKSL